MRCAVDSGLCVDDGAGPSDAQPVVAGGFALVGLPGLRHAIAAYVPSRKSLVWMERGDGSATINYVVGEGVGEPTFVESNFVNGIEHLDVRL